MGQNMSSKRLVSPVFKRLTALIFVLGMVACSSSGNRPKPAELMPLLPMMSVRQAWQQPLGGHAGNTPGLSAHGDKVFASSGSGQLALIDVASGADVWRIQLGVPLSAGVGADGHLAAVVSERNDVIAVAGGKEVWRQHLTSAVYTPPLVAGQRVFVVGADRTVSAFDGNTGTRLWSQSKSSDGLVLRQAGVLTAIGDTLVVGLGGRLVGLNPNNGSVRWDVAMATPRGGNDVERLVDLLAPVSRLGNDLCARAYQAAVACVDTQSGRLKWTQIADGRTGVTGDDKLLIATESDGRVMAWQRSTGQKAWSDNSLLHRDLGSPLILGRSVAVPDGLGLVHLLSREDGHAMARLTTDGSPAATAPVLAGDTLMVFTRNGNLFAWRPQ